MYLNVLVQTVTYSKQINQLAFVNSPTKPELSEP